MSPCPECLFVIFDMYPPPPPLATFLTWTPPCLLSCLLHPPLATLPWWEQFPVGNMQTPQIHLRRGCATTSPNRRDKLCGGTPWCFLKWDFKDAAKRGMNFLCRTVCSVATWGQTGNVRNVFSICHDRRYMCDMHANSPSPQMHVGQNPTKHKCLSLGMLPRRW